uniref:(northern house mosquito) hypothetical protein n=1 Tax=Culex pipiens TaxID=7175 RepID=A0A8D8DFT7_CULPI
MHCRVNLICFFFDERLSADFFCRDCVFLFSWMQNCFSVLTLFFRLANQRLNFCFVFLSMTWLKVVCASFCYSFGGLSSMLFFRRILFELFDLRYWLHSMLG